MDRCSCAGALDKSAANQVGLRDATELSPSPSAWLRSGRVQFEPVTEMQRMKITATTAIGALAISQGE